jgi:hypothetical protein
MKLVHSLIIAAAVALPAVSFAQSNGPVTRAQVYGELVQLQKAGYNPSSDQTQYPKNIQAVEARISAENGVTTSYGSPVEGTSASGAPASSTSDLNSLYRNP